MSKSVGFEEEDTFLDASVVAYKREPLSEVLDELFETDKLTVGNYLEYGWEQNGFCQIFKSGDVVTILLSVRFGTANQVLTLPIRI